MSRRHRAGRARVVRTSGLALVVTAALMLPALPTAALRGAPAEPQPTTGDAPTSSGAEAVGLSATTPDDMISAITAVNVPPLATYEVEVHPTFPEELVDFHWELTPDPREPNCTNFRYERNRAFWRHADEDGCTHPGVEHDGLITVRATDGVILEDGEVSGGTWVCNAEYPDGSRTGTGPPPQCDDVDLRPDDPDDPDIGDPEEEICEIRNVKGRLQPTQAVWQDDQHWFPPWLGPPFGRQLSFIGDTTAFAELPLVKDKPTVIIGVWKYWNRTETFDFMRDPIVLEGETRGTQAVDARVRFHAEGVGTSPTLNYTEDVRPLPLGGECGDWQEFKVEVDAPLGVPPPGQAFRFTGTGTYSIIAELESPGGTPYGVSAQVTGEVLETTPPRVLFAPVFLSASTAAQRDRLGALSESAERNAREFIPDYWPLAPDRWDGFALPWGIRLFGFEDIVRTWEEFQARKSAGDPAFPWAAQKESLIHIFGLANRLNPGRRVLAIVEESDFDKISETAAALALSRDLILLWAADADNHWLIAHELTHTMPYLWSTPKMLEECSLNHHNNSRPIAFGTRVTLGGEENRARFLNRLNYMSAYHSAVWNDQCTYWNLTKYMSGQANGAAPQARGSSTSVAQTSGDVLFVQGGIAKVGTATAGELLPAYTTSTPPDLPAPSDEADHAIVLRSATGAELARHSFAPEFHLVVGDEHDEDIERPFIYFAYGVPREPGTARIQLVGPSGVMDELGVTPNAPEVTLLEPGPGTTLRPSADTLRVRWEGSDADGDDLLYTLLHSTDDGESWIPVLVDSDATSHDLDVAPGLNQRLRLIATDGVNSDEAEIAFSVIVQQRVGSRVTLRYAPRAQRFGGVVRSPRPRCARSRTVRLFRRTSQARRVAQTRTNNRGRFQFGRRFPNPAGRFFARAARKSFTLPNGTEVICRPARSNILRRR